MKSFRFPAGWRWAASALMLALPASARACATCFGASDAPMAKGLNMGIFSLLIVVVVVLGAFTAFFLHLARRSARSPLPMPDALEPLEPVLPKA